jgi:hypothetical protein
MLFLYLPFIVFGAMLSSPKREAGKPAKDE